jgi:type II secretory pathway predicted ATPase ExeA
VYEHYFGLREPAFRKTPDPRYLFPSEAHEEALERLVFAAEEREISLLTGGVGAGKTLLTRALVDRLGDRYEVAMLLHPRLTPRQLLAVVAAELGIARPAARAGDLVAQLHERLLELDRAGRAALLIVDEAQLVPSRATFEEIRLLTNFQLDDRGLIAVVLAGPPELRERLRRRAYRALTQRIGAAFELLPLSAAECAEYLRHRLAVAGTEREIFTPAAARALHRASGGVPRVLNQLATQALLEAMARGVAMVDAATVDAVAADEVFLEPRTLLALAGRPSHAARAASGRRAR